MTVYQQLPPQHLESDCKKCGIDHLSWSLLRDIEIINATDIEDKSELKCSKCKGLLQ